MKDIDFDELDRAVNSLIGGGIETVERTAILPSAPVVSAAAVAPDLTAPTPISAPAVVIDEPIVKTELPPIELAKEILPQAAPAVASQPVVSPQLATQPVQPTPPAVRPQTITRLVAVPYPPRPRPLITTPVAPAKTIPINTFESLASKRGSGRFVDVVNPTSQNRLDSRRFSASTTETIKQMMSGTTELHEHTMPVVEPVIVSPTPTVATLPTAEIPNPPAVVNPAPVAPDDDDDIEQINSFIDSTINSSNKKQDEKPFFNDAKVDKRPLGAFNGATPQVLAPVPSTAIQFGISGNSGSASAQLPPELQNDLLSIESDTMPELETNRVIDIPAIDTAKSEPNNFEVQAAEQPVASPTVQPQSGNVIAIAPVQVPQTVAPAAIPQASIQTSINQQYQEKPSSTPTATEPIYDATAYHELDKKTPKSGLMMWTIRIIGLIVIGAGVGVLAFFFVLPNL